MATLAEAIFDYSGEYCAPKLDEQRPMLAGLAPKVNGLAPKADGLAPEADGLVPKVDELAPQRPTDSPSRSTDYRTVAVRQARKSHLVLLGSERAFRYRIVASGHVRGEGRLTVGPWDPNWRPDPTGRRLIAIRAARRGALAAAVIFGGLEVVAAMVTRPAAADTPGADLLVGTMLALFSLPGLALLGAGLTSAALGSRSSAASAGLAMGVGVPVAAVTSAMIGAFMLVSSMAGAADGADVAGTLLRAGVTAAVRISPLIALASAGWVVLVRRMERSSSNAAARDGGILRSIRRGRGPRRRGG